jgi:hypothetical protein
MKYTLTYDSLLYKILGKVLATLYDNNLGGDQHMSETNMTTNVFELHGELETWRMSLPACVTFCISGKTLISTSDGNSHLKRYRTVLALRFYHVQSLLFRPVLVRILENLRKTKPSNEPGPITSTSKQRPFGVAQQIMTQNCLCAAKELIRLVFEVLTTPNLGRTYLGAWWFTLYYGTFAFSHPATHSARS